MGIISQRGTFFLCIKGPLFRWRVPRIRHGADLYLLSLPLFEVHMRMLKSTIWTSMWDPLDFASKIQKPGLIWDGPYVPYGTVLRPMDLWATDIQPAVTQCLPIYWNFIGQSVAVHVVMQWPRISQCGKICTTEPTRFSHVAPHIFTLCFPLYTHSMGLKHFCCCWNLSNLQWNASHSQANSVLNVSKRNPGWTRTNLSCITIWVIHF